MQLVSAHTSLSCHFSPVCSLCPSSPAGLERPAGAHRVSLSSNKDIKPLISSEIQPNSYITLRIAGKALQLYSSFLPPSCLSVFVLNLKRLSGLKMTAREQKQWLWWGRERNKTPERIQWRPQTSGPQGSAQSNSSKSGATTRPESSACRTPRRSSYSQSHNTRRVIWSGSQWSPQNRQQQPSRTAFWSASRPTWNGKKKDWWRQKDEKEHKQDVEELFSKTLLSTTVQKQKAVFTKLWPSHLTLFGFTADLIIWIGSTKKEMRHGWGASEMVSYYYRGFTFTLSKERPGLKVCDVC